MMDKTKLMRERRELLDRIEQEFAIAQMREPEGEDEPPILSVIFDGLGMEHEEAYGEFYFLNIPDEDTKVQHFAAAITIADEIEEERLGELFRAMSYVNFAVPCGAYSIDGDHRFLSYRLTVPLPIEMEGEDLYNEVNIVMANAVAVTDMHMDLLLKVLSGEEDANSIKEALNGR